MTPKVSLGLCNSQWECGLAIKVICTHTHKTCHMVTLWIKSFRRVSFITPKVETIRSIKTWPLHGGKYL